jgi:hypothetical protein
MSHRKGVKLVSFYSDEPQTIAQAPLPQVELKHFQNVVGNVTQDALSVWDEIWGELQQAAHTGVAIVPGTDEDSQILSAESSAGEPFKPSCGWPEFMEKMWLLRHYLDFMARFSRP